MLDVKYYVLLPSALDVLVGGALLAELERRGYLSWQHFRTILALGLLGLAGQLMLSATARNTDLYYIFSGLFLAFPMITRHSITGSRRLNPGLARWPDSAMAFTCSIIR